MWWSGRFKGLLEVIEHSCKWNSQLYVLLQLFLAMYPGLEGISSVVHQAVWQTRRVGSWGCARKWLIKFKLRSPGRGRMMGNVEMVTFVDWRFKWRPKLFKSATKRDEQKRWWECCRVLITDILEEIQLQLTMKVNAKIGKRTRSLKERLKIHRDRELERSSSEYLNHKELQ